MGRAEERQARQRGARRAARGRPSGGGKPKRTGIRRFFTWKKMLGTLFGFVLLGMLGFVVLYMVVDIPEGNALAKKQSNVYKYSDGTIIARTGDVNREIVDLDKVPEDVQKAFVAAENKSFYKDEGVDFKGTARGVLNTVTGKGKQGGSTITQQYVKNYYLSQEQTVSRKLKELVVSLKVDREKSKDDILAGYINTSYYGRGAYGIQAAAQAYYGIDAKELDVDQGAYLAALLQAPSQYDWAVASPTGRKLVKQRWNYVLDNMVEEGWLDSGKRAELTFAKPEDPKAPPGREGQVGYLVEEAKREVLRNSDLSEAEFEAGGYTVTLNIDPKKQKQLQEAVDKKLNDRLDRKDNKADARVQAGAASVDPRNGKVLAMYGGEDYVKHYTNNATRRDYQAASTFKPLILAAALEHGATTQDGKPITAGTVYDGTSKRPVKGSDVGFAPPNEDDVDYGPVTVQKAMNKSINSVFAQMGVDVGMPEVMEMAGKLGMDVKGLPAVPAQTLGSMGASPLEMAGVYATLDNHGKKVTPALVGAVEHKDRTVDLPDPIGDQVIKRGTADSVTSVLTGVVDDGTGSAVRNPSQDVAGKTGTSDDNKSAWFTGYTPKLVTAVGLFGEGAPDTPEKNKQVSMKGAGGRARVDGGSFPADIWAAYTFEAMGSPTAFDLDTDMGAAIAPPPEPTTKAPKEPTNEPTEPEDDPTTKPPSQSPTTKPPSDDPTTKPPSDDPTTKPPTTEPGPSDTAGEPDEPEGLLGRD
ncbi:penicillin-binding protein [Streptomyces alfalfae]|uniref:Penicillin-binding protein n=2 Tax=Streptomyces alfalfae TaxID=1642299 RepID=A0A1P8TG92_9ACTN|nr:transglycosylase domain-containing protein [Streptomyces alfalfae]AYA16997.1 penicillin-binding protein [Streptomyces fradiae]APY86609.1 penicillin-binding protein [Streptomyces alfalfae]QQC91129.1 penicillin-binding protein [Streptomyces alfalfae]QUI33617.1 penicillin-binding protein [Streptomyces alfalfae]RXX47739.1 penicillin-binding protein [Streptomyces alfalfae]